MPKKLWHKGAWRDALWTNNAMNVYAVAEYDWEGLNGAELKESDAKKQLWYNGAWHDAVWKDNVMNSYVDGDKFITLTPAELAASDAERKRKQEMDRRQEQDAAEKKRRQEQDEAKVKRQQEKMDKKINK